MATHIPTCVFVSRSNSTGALLGSGFTHARTHTHTHTHVHILHLYHALEGGGNMRIIREKKIRGKDGGHPPANRKGGRGEGEKEEGPRSFPIFGAKKKTYGPKQVGETLPLLLLFLLSPPSMSSSQKIVCTVCKQSEAKKFEFGPRKLKIHLDQHAEAQKRVAETRKKTSSLVETRVAMRTAVKEEIRRWIHRHRGANTTEFEHRILVPSVSDRLCPPLASPFSGPLTH